MKEMTHSSRYCKNCIEIREHKVVPFDPDDKESPLLWQCEVCLECTDFMSENEIPEKQNPQTELELNIKKDKAKQLEDLMFSKSVRNYQAKKDYYSKKKKGLL